MRDPNTLRRSLLQSLLAASLTTGGGISGIIQAALANGNNPAPPGIRRIKGRVTINGWPAAPNMPVHPGDTVVTGDDGEAIYVIGQDAFLQRKSTTVHFGDSIAGSIGVGLLRVITGGLLSVFAKGEKHLEVPTATIGIRGTGCYIEILPDSTYFCLCYGSAEIVPTAAPDQRETITTTHHDHPLTISADTKMPSLMAKAKVVNHTDAELIMLENLVGREPPFVSSGGGYRSY